VIRFLLFFLALVLLQLFIAFVNRKLGVSKDAQNIAWVIFAMLTIILLAIFGQLYAYTSSIPPGEAVCGNGMLGFAMLLVIPQIGWMCYLFFYVCIWIVKLIPQRFKDFLRTSFS